MKCLQYPLNVEYIMKKKRSLRRELLADGRKRNLLRIAVLGGSTTNEIVTMLELFLLDAGIEPVFYESEYNQYYNDAVFPNEKLEKFAPELIYFHTSNRNIECYPDSSYSQEDVDRAFENEMSRFTGMWDKTFERYNCPIIQNNMELPLYRLYGNRDGVYPQGATAFVRRLNEGFAQYAKTHENFYIHDMEYLSSCYGLDRFSDQFYWHMYKYCMAVPAIPEFAYSLSAIIKSLLGKNKKGLVLDLDNTLWGGVIGDDGTEGIELGKESSMGQVYSEFQEYVRKLKDIGVLLTIDSKNDENNALAGLRAPFATLKEEDFLVIKANWEPKDRNLEEIASELGILPESLVFVDDNPAERNIVEAQIPGVIAPEIDKPENYARILDRSGFFEVTNLSSDDRKRNEMYKENMERNKLSKSFESYDDYLKSLEMKAVIKPFDPLYYGRITQLTNKSNQFNLTTRRYTQSEIEELAEREDVVTLYGSLEDKFGDNGIVSVVIAHREKDNELHIDLWLMSCRVLKRKMECAMCDELVRVSKELGIQKIYGYYYPTPKNSMVKEFYKDREFELLSNQNDNDSIWVYDVSLGYVNQNDVIEIMR